MPERWRRGDENWEAECRLLADAAAEISLDGLSFQIRALSLEDGELRFELAGQTYRLSVLQSGGKLELTDGRNYYRFEQLEEGEESPDAASEKDALLSKMPGRILALKVEPGAEVHKGEVLLILEAMKMEHEILAPAAGILRAYPRQVGERVMPGDLLAEFEPLA